MKRGHSVRLSFLTQNECILVTFGAGDFATSQCCFENVIGVFCLISDISKKLQSPADPAIIFYYKMCDVDRVLHVVTSHCENNDMDQG